MYHVKSVPFVPNVDSVVDTGMLGMDVLGFRNNSQTVFEGAGEGSVVDALGTSFVRWPGALISEEMNAYDGEGRPLYDDDGIPTSGRTQFRYDLTDPDVLFKVDGDGERIGRDGLQAILEDCVQSGQDLVMLLPTETYLSYDEKTGRVTIDENRAAEEVYDFVTSLLGGDRFGGDPYDLPNKIVFQVGQEYYVERTLPTSAQNRSDADAVWDSYVDAVGRISSVIVASVDEARQDVASSPSKYVHSDADVRTAVQAGRFGSRDTDDGWYGSVSDVERLIEAFDADGFAGIDMLLWQRYSPVDGQLERLLAGYSEDRVGTGMILEDAIDAWEAGAAQLGVDLELDVLAGTSIAVLTRTEALRRYNADPSTGTLDPHDPAFRFDTRSNLEFERYYQAIIEEDAFGEDLPAAILEHLTELVGAGVDMATVYSGELLNTDFQGGRLSAALVDDDTFAGNDQTVLLAGGQMYQRFFETVDGMMLVSGGGEVTSANDAVNINVYRDHDTIVVYASATELSGQLTATIDLSAYWGEQSVLSATSLTAEVIDDWSTLFGVKDLTDNWSSFDQSAEAAIYSELVEGAADVNMIDNGVFEFTFSDSWDVIEIIVDIENERNSELQLPIRVVCETDISEPSVGTLDLRDMDEAVLIDRGSSIYSVDIDESGLEFDVFYLPSRDDAFIGAEEDETVFGNEGKDQLQGRGGNDVLHGGEGADHIDGGVGNDVVTGGAGGDFHIGGAGDDTFCFCVDDMEGFEDGRGKIDVIDDFVIGEDTISFEACDVVSGLDDLLVWAGDDVAFIRVRGTDLRIELDGSFEDADLADTGNFLF